MKFSHALIPLGCVLVGVALLGVFAVAPAFGAPPPLSVCGVCDSIDGATDAGTLDVHVDEDGDSRWVARVPINETAAETYRDDPDALESAVNEGWSRSDIAINDAREIESSVEDGSVEVAYTVPDVARSGVGDGWVVDYFYVAGTPDRYDLQAERVSIHTPDGTHVANSPQHADVDGGTVTWTSGGDGNGGTFARNTHVSYGPEGVGGTLSAWASAGTVFGPLVFEHAVLGSFVPVTFLGLAAVAATRPRMAEYGAGAAVGRAVVDQGQRTLEGLCGRFGWSHSRPVLLGVAVGAVAVASVGGWLVNGLGLAILVASFGFAAALFLPLGHALERGDRWVRYVTPSLLAPVVAIAAFAPYYVLGFGPIAASVFFVPWAIGAGASGYLLSLIGRRIAARTTK
ncbi:hypothetical protein ACLI4Z_14735 [Natrialbaceae archaeon A-arb3/5]